LVPVKALARLVRGKLRDALARQRPDLYVPPLAWRQPWVVHAAAWGTGPQAVLDYLARYLFRVAITNHRIVALDAEAVTIRYKKRKSTSAASVPAPPPSRMLSAKAASSSTSSTRASSTSSAGPSRTRTSPESGQFEALAGDLPEIDQVAANIRRSRVEAMDRVDAVPDVVSHEHHRVGEGIGCENGGIIAGAAFQPIDPVAVSERVAVASPITRSLPAPPRSSSSSSDRYKGRSFGAYSAGDRRPLHRASRAHFLSGRSRPRGSRELGSHRRSA
jgi:Putative transposase